MAAPLLPNLVLPPISLTGSPQNPKSYFPATIPTAGAWRATPFVACSAATVRSGGRVNPDDYHSTLRALNSKGRLPRKSLGQHYMLDSSINEQLAAAANVKEGDVVLEIGPGTGLLTNVLINSGATVLAGEKNSYMAALVDERFASTNRLKVLNGDFVMSCELTYDVVIQKY